MDLNGKNVVISGGIGKIGIATCQHLIRCNISSVAILDIVEDQEEIDLLKAVDSRVNILFIKTDVTNKEKVENAFKTIIQNFKTIDIVICNAGISNEHKMEQTMEVNFLGVVHMTLAAMPLMSKSNGHNGGIMMAVSSVNGLEPTYFALPATVASKHAVIGFYRALSNDFYFKKHNIKFLLMCPGSTSSGFIDRAIENLFDSDARDPTLELIESLPVQSSDTMGKLLVNALKVGENGSTWIADDGKLKVVEFTKYWPLKDL